MEVILKQDIKGLGFKNDTVKVRPGYGRNYLIPQGYAIIANDSNKKMIAENIRQAAHKAEKMKADALALSEKIQTAEVVIATKAGETGKIFGAVTTLQISDALKAKGMLVDRKQISIPESIKELGDHKAVIVLHKEISLELAFKVVAE